jgi:aryl-alcohol dehydrogenase
MVPLPMGDQVLVDVDAVGGCHADTSAHSGSFPVAWPIVLGHEGTGVVRAIGPQVRSLQPGDRVVLTYDHCGQCSRCRSGEPTQCLRYAEHNFPTKARTVYESERGSVNAGFFGQSSFATHSLASERNAVRVETSLAPELLAPLGCGIQTGVGAVTNVAQLRRTQSLVVVGLGAVGFAALFAATDIGATSIIAVDIDDSRLALAEDVGTLATVDASRLDWWADVRRTLGGGADVVVECSGAPSALAAAIKCVRPGGTVVVAGAPPFGHEARVDVADLVNRSVTIRGTAEGGGRARERIPKLARMVESGALPLGRIVQSIAFDEVPGWLKEPRSLAAVKPVFRLPPV